jgi:acetate kinase
VRVLVLNAGSSSLKASLIEAGQARGRTNQQWSVAPGGAADRAQTLQGALNAIGSGGAPDAVSHRVVHGGERFLAPTLLDGEAVASLQELSDLAPLHNPPAIETISAAREAFPDIPHVACFDTAFHASLPETELTYPVPVDWRSALGIRRYGFHGLSVEWAVGRTAELLAVAVPDLQLVVAHLGSGCSVTAVSAGRSRWTSMGFTPLEGLMMGTRSGSIDPGLLLHLLRSRAIGVDELSEALEHGSGLRGVSGLSGDLREVQQAADSGDERAALAIEMFVARAAGWIAFAATALERLDALAFTGGIGEQGGRVRARIVRRLAVLGITPIGDDETGNDRLLGGRKGAPSVLRIEAREDLVMAKSALTLI